MKFKTIDVHNIPQAAVAAMKQHPIGKYLSDAALFEMLNLGLQAITAVSCPLYSHNSPAPAATKSATR